MAGKRDTAYFNFSDGPTAKSAFAYRLQQKMAEKGWNQSELARQASRWLPRPTKGQKQGIVVGRDLISNYIRGETLPRPPILVALAKALDCTETDLLAPRSVPSAGRPDTGFLLQARGADTAYLEVRREMPMLQALEIIKILNQG